MVPARRDSAEPRSTVLRSSFLLTGIYRNLESLIAARARYARINVPVTLVYGDNDWSRPSDRKANIESVPGARDIALRDTGHFAALEAPDDWARILLGDAPERAAQPVQ